MKDGLVPMPFDHVFDEPEKRSRVPSLTHFVPLVVITGKLPESGCRYVLVFTLNFLR